MRDIDFLPEGIRDQRARRRSLIRQGQLTAVCLVGLAVLGMVRQRSLAEAREELAKVRDQAANVRYQLTFRSMLEKQKAELMIKKRIDDQLGSRVIGQGGQGPRPGTVDQSRQVEIHRRGAQRRRPGGFHRPAFGGSTLRRREPALRQGRGLWGTNRKGIRSQLLRRQVGRLQVRKWCGSAGKTGACWL